jgi:site-specific DNA-methyltransferase (adenine-specific)
MDELKVTSVAISTLKLDGRNARSHSDQNIIAIKKSLQKFGQRKPIVVHDGVVIAGNGTLTAAQGLGWETIAVAEIPADWDANMIKAYALADNRTAELADWNQDVLASILLELDESGWDLGDIGFELPQTIGGVEIGEDEIPEPPADPKVKIGEVWQLGDHKLLCGDATAIGSYKLLLGDEKVDMVWTDPPYGVAYVGKTKDALTIENDTLNHAQLTEFLRNAFTAIKESTKPGACWYVAAPSGDLFQAFSIPLFELEVWRHTLVWVKDTLVMGRADYHYRHESIFYGWTPGAAHQTPPDRKQDTVWEIPRPKANKEHPTMKPIELIVRSIGNSSLARDLILDPFGGSGSTLIAAEQTKRRARLMELDPKYCDVIITRWEAMTGQTAVLLNPITPESEDAAPKDLS